MIISVSILSSDYPVLSYTKVLIIKCFCRRKGTFLVSFFIHFVPFCFFLHALWLSFFLFSLCLCNNREALTNDGYGKKTFFSSLEMTPETKKVKHWHSLGCVWKHAVNNNSLGLLSVSKVNVFYMWGLWSHDLSCICRCTFFVPLPKKFFRVFRVTIFHELHQQLSNNVRLL